MLRLSRCESPGAVHEDAKLNVFLKLNFVVVSQEYTDKIRSQRTLSPFSALKEVAQTPFA